MITSKQPKLQASTATQMLQQTTMQRPDMERQRLAHQQACRRGDVCN